jgi:hypothetical protein
LHGNLCFDWIELSLFSRSLVAGAGRRLFLFLVTVERAL